MNNPIKMNQIRYCVYANSRKRTKKLVCTATRVYIFKRYKNTSTVNNAILMGPSYNNYAVQNITSKSLCTVTSRVTKKRPSRRKKKTTSQQKKRTKIQHGLRV